MVYFIGFVGLALGFALGQLLLAYLLKDYTKQQLLEDRDLRVKYGVINWFLALLGCVASVWMYQNYTVLPG